MSSPSLTRGQPHESRDDFLSPEIAMDPDHARSGIHIRSLPSRFVEVNLKLETLPRVRCAEPLNLLQPLSSPVRCSHPGCIALEGHCSIHSSPWLLRRCSVRDCIFTVGHFTEHKIRNVIMPENSKLTTDNALAMTREMSQLNRKVLGAMSEQDKSPQMEKVKQVLLDQRTKRQNAISKLDKPMVAECCSAATPVITDGTADGSSIYMKLELSNLEIRLFELYPSQAADKIQGAFRCANMSRCPDYTALSYTWGDDTTLRQIHFENGTKLGIRENLWQFLCGQSQLIDKPKLFWIDAICINQSNIHERNHQVNLMRQIYAWAKHVYIWLGQDDDDSDLAMDFLASRAKRKLKRRGFGYRSLWSWQEGRAMMHLWNRPYWRRMWIIQEIIYAKDITVWCGRKSCEWSAAEILYLKMKSLEDENWQTHHEYVVQVLQSSAAVMIWQRAHWRHPHTTAPSLMTLIDIFREWQCTDIRDKVYSLVGMASRNTTITPDYSLSTLQLYHCVMNKSWGGEFGGVLSQILSIPTEELEIDLPDLIEYRRHAPDKLVLKARIQSDWNSGNMC